MFPWAAVVTYSARDRVKPNRKKTFKGHTVAGRWPCCSLKSYYGCCLACMSCPVATPLPTLTTPKHGKCVLLAASRRLNLLRVLCCRVRVRGGVLP